MRVLLSIVLLQLFQLTRSVSSVSLMSSFPKLHRWSEIVTLAALHTRYGSQSSRPRGQPSDGWHRMNLALGSSMLSRRRSTSPRCERARPGIIIEIRWRSAHKGIAGNERADEWANIAAEEPDTRGVEWLNHPDRTEVRAMHHALRSC